MLDGNTDHQLVQYHIKTKSILIDTMMIVNTLFSIFADRVTAADRWRVRETTATGTSWVSPATGGGAVIPTIQASTHASRRSWTSSKIRSRRENLS